MAEKRTCLTSSATPVAPANAGPDRRQVLNGVGALLASTALPVVSLTAAQALRPGGWILHPGDRDVS